MPCGRKIKSGLRSTKQALVDVLDGQVELVSIKSKKHCIFTKTYDLHRAKNVHGSNWPFSVRSYRENQYIMVLIELDGNSILVEAMENRTSGEIISAYQTLGRSVESLRN